MDILNETVLLKAKSTLFNLFIRETSQLLCYERLLNMTYVAYKKMHFSAKCNSGRIAIQWFHIKHYLDYQYTKFQPYTFRVQKMCVFARYATLVPRLLEFTLNLEIKRNLVKIVMAASIDIRVLNTSISRIYMY